MFTSYLLFLTLIFSHMEFGTCQSISLSSNYKNESFCPGELTFVCNTSDISFVMWCINGSEIGIYQFSSSDSFPLDVPVVNQESMNFTGTVKVIAAIYNSSLDITSKLTGSFYNLEGLSVSCDCYYNNSYEEYYVVSAHVPETPVEVNITKSNEANPFLIKLIWRVSSLDCPGVNYTYNVLLLNSSGYDVDNKTILCESTHVCETQFTLTSPDEYFRINITATNHHGQSRVPYQSHLFNYQNLPDLPTPLPTTTSLAHSGPDVPIIVGSVAAVAFANAILCILLLWVLCKKKKRFNGKLDETEVDASYDEVIVQNHQVVQYNRMQDETQLPTTATENK